MSHTILSIREVFKGYGSIPVLKNVSFDVNPAEALVIIGPNGAGKTTLFRVLSGEAFATSGKVFHSGDDISLVPAHKRVRRGFARTFQVSRTLHGYTVRENLVVAIESERRFRSKPGGRSLAPVADVVAEAAAAAETVGLEAKLDQHAGLLSHGDKKRLEIAMALALKPSVLLMDEPTAGMSPSERRQMVELVASVRRQFQLTVVLTEHDMDVVFGLADRIMVLNYGEVIAIGTPDEIRNNEMVRRVYLGEEMLHA